MKRNKLTQQTIKMMKDLNMYGIAISEPIQVNQGQGFNYEIDVTMVNKNTPGKITFKVPMKKQVIDEIGRLFEYEIKDKKPVYTFLCAILPEY